MTIVSSGAISINSLVGEYGGSAPHSMNEYYKGGGLVANHSNNANVPTSSTISLSNFYGQSNTNPAPSSHSYSMAVGTNGILEYGYSTSPQPSTYGSLSNNPQSTAFASGWNPTITGLLSTTVKSNSTITFTVSGNQSNSGWTSIYIPASIVSNSSNQTLQRSGANHSQSNGGTHWQWSTFWNFTFNTATVIVYA